MKYYQKFIAAGMALCITLFSLMPSSSNAAGGMKSALIMENGKEYSYDMDFDGNKDTIKYESKEKKVKGKYKTEYVLTVNGEVIFDGEDDISGQFYLTDIDKNDKQIDFILLAEYTSSGAVYYTYENGKLERRQDLEKICKKTTGYKYANCHTMYPEEKSVTSDGKGKVTIPVCVSTKAVGYAHLEMTLQLRGNKLVDKSKGKMGLIEDQGGYSCDSSSVKKSFPLYKSAGSKTVAFNTKKGDVLKYKSAVFKKGKGYLKVEVKGKTGWLGMDQFKDSKYFYLDGTAHA